MPILHFFFVYDFLPNVASDKHNITRASLLADARSSVLHSPTMSVYMTDNWQAIIGYLQWYNLRRLWMTGDRRIQAILLKCRHLAISIDRCQWSSSQLNLRLLRPSTCLSNVDATPAYVGAWCHPFSHPCHGPVDRCAAFRYEGALYNWACKTFAHIVEWLEQPYGQTIIPTAFESTNFATNSFFMPWQCLRTLALEASDKLQSMTSDLHLPSSITVLKITDTRSRDVVMANAKSHVLIIATGLEVLEVSSKHVTFDRCESDWTWRNIVAPNAAQLQTLKWIIDLAMPMTTFDAITIMESQPHWMDIGSILPNLQTLVLHNHNNAPPVILNLPSSLTCLDITADCNAIPDIGNTCPSVHSLRLVSHDSIGISQVIKLLVACPNVQLLDVNVKDAYTEVGFTDIDLLKHLSSVTHVTKTTFTSLLLHMHERFPPNLQNITPSLAISLDCYDSCYGGVVDSKQISAVRALWLCRRLPTVPVDLQIDEMVPKITGGIYASLLTQPNIQKIHVRSMARRRTSTHKLDVNTIRKYLMSITDIQFQPHQHFSTHIMHVGCMGNNTATLQATLPIAMSSKFANLKQLDISCGINLATPPMMPETDDVPLSVLPSMLERLSVHWPHVLSTSMLSMLPKSLTSLSINLGGYDYESVTSMVACFKLLIECDAIWEIDSVFVNGQYRVSVSDELYHGMKTVGVLLKKKRLRVASHMRMSAGYSQSYTAYGFAVGCWRFGHNIVLSSDCYTKVVWHSLVDL